MTIINFPQSAEYRFAVYESRMMNVNRELISFRFIVIKSGLNIIESFTGFEQYSGKYTGKKPKIELRDKHELEYICRALNYLIFSKYNYYKVDKVSQISNKMIFEFFDHYRKTRMVNGRFPGQQSIDKCVNAVTSFFCNVALEIGSMSAINTDDLVTEVWSKRNNKSQKVYQNYIPRYQKKSLEKTTDPLLRDIPINAIPMLINEANIHDPEIAFPIVAQSTTGVRPGEVVNFRREDSPLGPGIKFEYVGSRVNRIEIDLRYEYLLRSDGKQTGKIKKERMVIVYPPFMNLFLSAYKKHLYLCEGKKYEAEFGPMFINKNGKAMSYKTYQERFQSLVNNHLRPRLLKSEDPLLQIFGQRLLTKNLSPHALRHYFSVMLALNNEDISQIMFFRGDKSPESALRYFENKGELIKAAGLAHEEAIEGLIGVGGNLSNAWKSNFVL